MRCDVGCNETTPAIAFYRFHEILQNDITFRVKTAIGPTSNRELQKREAQIRIP